MVLSWWREHLDVALHAAIVAAVSVLTGALLWAVKNLRIVTKPQHLRRRRDKSPT